MRALLVDDDVSSASLVKLAVEPENITVERTESGLEALDMVKRYDFDVMILEQDLSDIEATGWCGACARPTSICR